MKCAMLLQLIVLAMLLAVGALTTALQAAPILEGFYTFSNPSNLGHDSSGLGNNLTNTSGVTSSGGNGPSFNGTNSSLATSPAAVFNGSNGVLTTGTGNVPTGFPTGGSAYTVTAWVNTSTSGNTFSSNGGIIGWGAYGNNGGADTDAFRLNGGGQGLQNYWWAHDLINTTATTVDSTWHMLAATYDGTTRTLYVDGTAVQSDTPGLAPNVTSANFDIGKTFNNEFFQGNMADVAVYSGALSQAQLLGIFDGKLNYSLQQLPEPSSCVLCGLGAIGLFCAARRQRRPA